MEDSQETLKELEYMDKDQFTAAHAAQEEIYNMPINYTTEERVMIGRGEANTLHANVPPPDSPKPLQHVPGLIHLGPCKTTATAPNRPLGDLASQPIVIDGPTLLASYTQTATKATPAGSVWKIVGKKSKTNPTPAPPNPPTQGPMNAAIPLQAYGYNKLSAKGTTKATIITHTEALFRKKLSAKMDKAKLINTYQQLVQGITITTTTNATDTNPQSKHNNNSQYCHRESDKFTSEWMIQCQPGTN
jgi:hypothetical protein